MTPTAKCGWRHSAPLPENLWPYTREIVNAIDQEIDVDCLTNVNLGKLVMKTNFLVPPTPGAVMSIIHKLNIDLIGKNATIIGAGPLVGKPLAIMMMNEYASVTVCNSKTKDTKEKCLPIECFIRPSRLFTADKRIINYRLDKLNEKKISLVQHKLCEIFTR